MLKKSLLYIERKLKIYTNPILRFLFTLLISGVLPVAANNWTWQEIPYAQSSAHIVTDNHNIWVASNGGGVYRYDPKKNHSQSFTRVNDGLADNIIYDMAIDSRKQLWIATVHGLSVFKDEIWRTFTSANTALKSNFITALAVDPTDDALWIGTYDTGLYRYDGTTWQHFEIPNLNANYAFVTSIAVNKQGEVWLGVWGEGVYRYANGIWTKFDPGNSQLSSYFVYVKTIEENGTVWFWCNNDYDEQALKVVAFHQANNEWKTYLQGETIHSMQTDQNGVVWAQSPNLLYKKVGDEFSAVKAIASDTNTSFPNLHLINTNKQGNLVVGTNYGFSINHYDQWQDQTAPGLAGNQVTDLLIDKLNTKWVATKAGLHKITAENKITILTDKNSFLPTEQINALAQSKPDILWIATRAGLVKYEKFKQRWQIFNTTNSGLISNNIADVAVAQDGSIWVSFSIYAQGVQRFDGTQWQLYTTKDGLTSNSISKIATHKNEVWLQSAQGISIYKNNQWQKLTIAEGLLSNNITSLTITNDHTWIGTDKGLIKYNSKNNEYFRDELPRAYVSAIYEDKQGNVFIGTRDGGLSILTRDKQWQHQTWQDGLTNSRITQIAQDKKGALWLGTEYGIGITTTKP
jgi:ligand-binding sensor domain-containing protein